jgi:hypothetical protein
LKNWLSATMKTTGEPQKSNRPYNKKHALLPKRQRVLSDEIEAEQTDLNSLVSEVLAVVAIAVLAEYLALERQSALAWPALSLMDMTVQASERQAE